MRIQLDALLIHESEIGTIFGARIRIHFRLERSELFLEERIVLQGRSQFVQESGKIICNAYAGRDLRCLEFREFARFGPSLRIAF